MGKLFTDAYWSTDISLFKLSKLIMIKPILITTQGVRKAGWNETLFSFQ